MFQAALKALNDVTSRPFRAILWKALGLTVLLFVILLVAVEAAISGFASFPWPWLEDVAAWAAGIGLFVLFIFIMAPVTALFAGLFLDEVAEIVERRDYPDDPPGRALAFMPSLLMGVETGLLMLVVFALALPLWFFAIGPVVMVVANAWLLGREFFILSASRHMSAREARRMRKQNAARVFAAGLLPALMAHVPLVNLFVPLFSTAYFVHIYKSLRGRGRQE